LSVYRQGLKKESLTTNKEGRKEEEEEEEEEIIVIEKERKGERERGGAREKELCLYFKQRFGVFLQQKIFVLGKELVFFLGGRFQHLYK
jgi:hypothetical protein